MQSIFDKETDRRGTGSMKWDVTPEELPMWVADMDFETAPAVQEAIRERAAHGVFGYTLIEDDWYEAYQNWWKIRHNFEIPRDWLIFCTGVVPAISSIVRKMTTAAEKVVVLTPVYNIFFNSIYNNGRNILESPLKYENGAYSIDFEDLEEKIADPQTSLMIFCNPHNPVGKIWDKETLEKVGDLCVKHHVLVLSDEIHCDLTEPGKDYVPFASVSENCRKNSSTCVAPTKAFNLAGLQTAAVIVPDPTIRHRVNRGLNTDEVAEPNVFAVDAAIAAFTKGEEWLEQLRAYIYENKQITEKFINDNIPGVSMVESHATYLCWLDVSDITDNSTRLAAYIRKNTGLFLSAGEGFGGDGKHFLRLNVACPKTTLMDGLERLRNGILSFER